MRIKPASGLKVRDSVSRQLLPSDGIDVLDIDGVPTDPYWQRLLADRDVVEDKPEVPPTQEAAPLPAPAAADEIHHDAEQPAHGS